jgi:hypothetical protein
MAKLNSITSATSGDREKADVRVTSNAPSGPEGLSRRSLMNMQSTIVAPISASAWDKAIATFYALEQVVAETPTNDEARLDAAVDAESKALDDLIRTPAPTIKAVMQKLELLVQSACPVHSPLTTGLGEVLSDLERFKAGNDVGSGDDELLKADQRMLTTLAAIEAHGTFFDAETTSPDEICEYDVANDHVGRAVASTIEGVLAKAWVAWSSHTVGGSEELLRFGDLVRRRDLATLKQMEDELDWEHHTMLTLIRSLTNMLQRNPNPRPAADCSSLSEELEAYGKQAAAIEEVIMCTSQVLVAIDRGGLLDAAPNQTDADYERHSAAVGLLHMLGKEIQRCDDQQDGTDLSIGLSVLAADLRK